MFFTSNVCNDPLETNRYVRYIDEFWLSDSYCSRHFLVGLLFQELLASLREPRDYRRRSIALLRNLLAKHAADKRYSNAEAQTRISVLYAPLLPFVVDNLYELEVTVKAVDRSPQRSPTRDISPANTVAVRKHRSVSSEWRSASLTSASQRLPSLAGESLKIPQSHPPVLPPPPPPPPNSLPNMNTANIAALTEKLDKNECRDLMLCTLYVLSKIPRDVLRAIWLQNDSIAQCSVLSFIRLLEVALELFKYRGKQDAFQRTSNKIRGTRRTMVITTTSGSTNASCSTTIESHASTSSGVSSMGTGVYLNNSRFIRSFTFFITLTNHSHPPGLSNAQLPSLSVCDDKDDTTTPFSVLQESNLTQEVALIVLETLQTLAQHIAVTTSRNNLARFSLA
ncbi:unnamed protein product [Anisakis simplex]|uniref:Zizimin ortholog (inferred by orthology to a D. melanogaster protein) n=1 Tax=Anisakis simplex TaxID=6269 RepID=A0A0M3KDW8_ANISI|nr:unnamed protein product [Anisakis simplex]